MKTIIAGGRDLPEPQALAILDSILPAFAFVITEVVSGACRGVDRAGELWAQRQGIPVRRFPADWATFGRRAGPIRNADMAGYADALVALWDGASRGTGGMIALARERGLIVHIHPITPPPPR